MSTMQQVSPFDVAREMVQTSQLQPCVELIVGIAKGFGGAPRNQSIILAQQYNDLRNKEIVGAAASHERASFVERLLSFIDRLEEIAGDGGPVLFQTDEADVAAPSTGVRLEAQVGDVNNRKNLSWIRRGLVVSKSVCRVRIPARGQDKTGTGFLIAGGRIVTNHHVIGDAETAGRALVDFNYEEDENGRALQPFTYELSSTNFVTDPDNDCSIITVNRSSNARPLDEWGALTFSRNPRYQENDAVVIVQHPGGGPKEISIANSVIVGTKHNLVFYTSDTYQGSSGSPVFDEDWHVIALHRSAGRHDEQRGGYQNNAGVLVSSLRDSGALGTRLDGRHGVLARAMGFFSGGFRR